MRLKLFAGWIFFSIGLGWILFVFNSTDYQIKAAYPHDENAFTQGLAFDGGYLYEGTGLKGRSTLRKVELETGRVIRQVALPPTYFGEGISVAGELVYQLTWKSQTGFIYNKHSLELVGQFSYPTEGWGLTSDGEYLIMSDGTATLRFLSLEGLIESHTIQVHDSDGPIINLNELEYINGLIYANIWLTDYIAVIRPSNGRLIRYINLSGLADFEPNSPDAVLNGIAYDPKAKRLFVTGKLWPQLYQLDIGLEQSAAEVAPYIIAYYARVAIVALERMQGETFSHVGCAYTREGDLIWWESQQNCNVRSNE